MSSIKLHISGLMAFTLAGILLSSCSEEMVEPASSDPQRISFKVSINDAAQWVPGNPKAAVSSRSGQSNRSGGSGIVSLEGGSKPLFLVPRVTEGIDRNVDNKTRSESYDSSTIPSFGVYATTSTSIESGQGFSADYMRNVEVTRQNNWTPAEKYLWPGKGSLRFNAYAPYQQSGGSEGILTLPIPGDESPVLEYQTPAQVADQEDMMYAGPTDASESPCGLTFNHALTAIQFAAGAELAPCTVKSITITEVKTGGKLNIETGTWETGNETSSFKVSPSITLSAEEGSEYVAAGTPITEGAEVMLLLPQTLTSDSQLTIEAEFNGTATTLTASLDGQTWKQGSTVTYRISANPASDQLVLDIAGSFDSPYTGTTMPYKVTSYMEDNGERVPVKWEAEFLDEDGNVIDRPVWLTSFTTEGEGTEELNAVTGINDVTFLSKSSVTTSLQSAADINTSSGQTPYNLSNATGGATVENTANCYIINAPGKYSLPLVYGNAIKGGATNTTAYISTKSGSSVLKTFINHLGNGISDPYIYNNTGCTPSSATLVWEDQLNTVREVGLTEDGHWLTFTIPANSIREGNALVAVKDGDGKIMWSWHLWITDLSAQTEGITIPGVTGETKILSKNVGEVDGGDQVSFDAASVKVRFTQTGLPEGIDPLTKTITITQAGATTTTPSYTTYYQWGRKDPMMSPAQTFYAADHTKYSGIPQISNSSMTNDGASLWSYLTQNPQTFLQASHTEKFDYLNLWTTNEGYTATTAHKTVYDPSPIGFRLQGTTLYTHLTSGAKTFTTQNGIKGYEVTGSGYDLFFPAFGYISGETVSLDGPGQSVNLWTCRARNDYTEAFCYQINQSTSGTISFNTVNDPRTHGFGVRPVNE